MDEPPSEGRNRTPNALLTPKIDRFFRLIKQYPPLHPNYTFTTFLLALPLTVDLLTNRDAAAQKCSVQAKEKYVASRVNDVGVQIASTTPPRTPTVRIR